MTFQFFLFKPLNVEQENPGCTERRMTFRKIKYNQIYVIIATYTKINQCQLLNKSKSLFMFQTHNQCKITWQSINNKLDVRHIYACVKIYGVLLSHIFEGNAKRIYTAWRQLIIDLLLPTKSGLLFSMVLDIVKILTYDFMYMIWGIFMTFWG